ncbi:MAG: hypothetical protein U0744_10060 [Gemmataceae bacterium]
MSYQISKGVAQILTYAGTTNERAQETLDVTLGELDRLVEGVTDDEIERVKAGLKSSVIMQEESTFAAPAPSRVSGITWGESAAPRKYRKKSTASPQAASSSM